MTISREDAEEWTAALQQSGDGQVRQALVAMRLGVPEALGLSLTEWQRQVFGGLVRLTIPERQDQARELTRPVDEGGEGLSLREAAEVLGVSKSTVADDVTPPVQNRTPEPEPEPETSDDVTPPVQNRTPEPEPEDRLAEAVRRYPELLHYVDTGRTRDALRLADALDGYTPRERAARRETLGRTIAAEQRAATADPEPEPGPDYVALADAMFVAANAAARALPDDGPDIVREAVAHTDPLEADNWRGQFQALSERCAALAAAAAPATLRRIK